MWRCKKAKFIAFRFALGIALVAGIIFALFILGDSWSLDSSDSQSLDSLDLRDSTNLSDSPTKMRILTPQAQLIKEKLQSRAQIGDLIFRKGKNSESELIAYLGDSAFSHIGIVANLAPLRIIHATTDDNPNAPNRVIQSQIDDFLAQAQVVGLKRLPLPQETREAIAKYALLSLGAPFVLRGSGDSLYCTTLVRDSIKANAPNFALNLPYKKINFAFLSGEYLLPSAFWEHSGFETILDISKVE